MIQQLKNVWNSFKREMSQDKPFSKRSQNESPKPTNCLPTYAIIINSRGRHKLLLQLLDSLYLRTAHPERVNVYVRVDCDDVDTLEWIKQYEQLEETQKVNWVIEDQTRHMNNNINLIVLNNHADFYWALNNDTEIMSNKWDLILDDYIQKYNILNKISYLYISDDISPIGGEHGCCFPIISNKAIQYMGCMFPIEIPANGADGQLYRIYQSIADRRIYQVPNIKIYHYCGHNKRIDSDDINARVGNMSTKGHLEKFEFMRYVNGLNRGIDEGY